MLLNESLLCPCRSGLSYAKCCRPFHQGKRARTPLQLMRSRYAAYALCLPEYIIATTHPQNPQFSSDASQWKREITAFSSHTQFLDLEILEWKEEESVGWVTFFARLAQNGRDISFTEKSRFEKIQGKWLYRSGATSPGRPHS